MGSRTLLVLKGLSPCPSCCFNLSPKSITSPSSKVFFLGNTKKSQIQNFSAKSTGTESSLPPPDVAQLAKTARISLTANEVEEFAPKIRQVVDWFGQLQAVDLGNVEPAIRADIVSENIRDDTPEIFENGEAIIAATPSYDEPYIKVPRVLNKE